VDGLPAQESLDAAEDMSAEILDPGRVGRRGRARDGHLMSTARLMSPLVAS